MSGAYVVVGSVLALALGVAAVLNLIHHKTAIVTADRLGLSRSLTRPFGVLLAAGAAGLVIGFVVPWVGLAAAVGVLLYFLVAIGVHVRARAFAPATGFPGAVAFALLAVVVLLVRLQAGVAVQSAGDYGPAVRAFLGLAGPG
ncbi:DoxX family protein [Nonomuraea sp. NPDC050663]|uniref:DoxX family protein n=1 Tax=Nonomuraea sp. NPDC050663 TaxID=3364370 RepID=UPI0037AC0C75